MPDVDVAILGGGCSGLSLGLRLARTGLSFRIVEPRPRYADDRAWSFWRTDRHPFEPAVRRSWWSWTVTGPGGTTRRGSGRLPYQTLSSGAVYALAQDRIHACPGGTLTLGARAETVTPGRDGAEIGCSDGSFTARHVVDTRPPRSVPAYGQFFLGREIVTERPVFDPDTVGLMHFRQGYSAGVDFLYTLPFAPDRALVEVTSFAPEAPAPDAFPAWLASEIDALGAGATRKVREETGALPMQVGFADPPLPGTVRMGLGGGAARPSTGYAFQRIQRQADRVAAQLAAGAAPAPVPDGPGTRFMDRVFLQVLARAPQRGPSLFQSLFAGVPRDRLERFLSGSTAAADRLSVMAALPPQPFLAAAVKPR